MTFELSRDDFDFLLMALGYAAGKASLDDQALTERIFKLANAINLKNPNWKPYALK
jgi:hypothetical protein